MEGEKVGALEGNGVGAPRRNVGLLVGVRDGNIVGLRDGDLVGLIVGRATAVGKRLDWAAAVGPIVGCVVCPRAVGLTD